MHVVNMSSILLLNKQPFTKLNNQACSNLLYDYLVHFSRDNIYGRIWPNSPCSKLKAGQKQQISKLAMLGGDEKLIVNNEICTCPLVVRKH